MSKNPPPLQLPQKIAQDPMLRRYFEDQNMFLLLLWRQVNELEAAGGVVEPETTSDSDGHAMLLMGG